MIIFLLNSSIHLKYAYLPCLIALWFPQVTANKVQRIYLQERSWGHRRLTEVAAILTTEEWLTQIGKPVTSKGRIDSFTPKLKRGGGVLPLATLNYFVRFGCE